MARQRLILLPSLANTGLHRMSRCTPAADDMIEILAVLTPCAQCRGCVASQPEKASQLFKEKQQHVCPCTCMFPTVFSTGLYWSCAPTLRLADVGQNQKNTSRKETRQCTGIDREQR